MITFNMSVAICQISIRNFVHFEISRLITVEKVYQHILQISLKVGLIESERFAAFRKHQEGLWFVQQKETMISGKHEYILMPVVISVVALKSLGV